MTGMANTRRASTGFCKVRGSNPSSAAQKPQLDAYAERWIRSLKTECLEQLILFGQRSLAYALQEYLAHHHGERNHQGLDNLIPFPNERLGQKEGSITKAERLGGLLKFYYRAAA
jgi:putative transposase